MAGEYSLSHLLCSACMCSQKCSAQYGGKVTGWGTYCDQSAALASASSQRRPSLSGPYPSSPIMMCSPDTSTEGVRSKLLVSLVSRSACTAAGFCLIALLVPTVTCKWVSFLTSEQDKQEPGQQSLGSTANLCHLMLASFAGGLHLLLAAHACNIASQVDLTAMM